MKEKAKKKIRNNKRRRWEKQTEWRKKKKKKKKRPGRALAYITQQSSSVVCRHAFRLCFYVFRFLYLQSTPDNFTICFEQPETISNIRTWIRNKQFSPTNKTALILGSSLLFQKKRNLNIISRAICWAYTVCPFFFHKSFQTKFPKKQFPCTQIWFSFI